MLLLGSALRPNLLCVVDSGAKESYLMKSGKMLQIMLFSIFLFSGGSAFTADITQDKYKPRPINKSTIQRAQALIPGTYKGPTGQRIQIKQTMTRRGAAADLAAKGIIVIDAVPVDGRYVGPGGASFLVQRGIIIYD